MGFGGYNSDQDPASLPTPVTDTRMSDEIVHNLDGCEVSLVGDDLDPERESLLLDVASLQQRRLELTNTSAYLTIAGWWGPRAFLLVCVCVCVLSTWLSKQNNIPLSLSQSLAGLWRQLRFQPCSGQGPTTPLYGLVRWRGPGADPVLRCLAFARGGEHHCI